MRTKILRPTVVCLLLSAAAASHAQLQLHLSFDENVGPTAFNDGLTGSANDATFNTANTRGVGQLGGAITFNGTASSEIVAGSNPLPDDPVRTVSFWLNTTVVNQGLDTYVSLGTNSNPTGTDPGTKFDISVDTNTGHLEIGVGGGRTDSAAATITTPALTDGTWRLATVVVPDILDDDPSLADMSDIDMYVDGTFSYDGSANSSPDRPFVTNPNGQLFLGRRANDGGGERPVGSLDDLAVWDIALTPDEIRGLYDVGSQLGIDAGVYDSVLSLHEAGAGTIFAGDYAWTYAGGLTGDAGIAGSSLVLDTTADTGVTFSVLVEGDVNRDSVVDQTDFGVIQSNFLSSVTSRDDGDLNGDGFVDFTDFRIWKDASLGSASASVPEPNGLALLTILTLFGGAAATRRTRGPAVAALALAVPLALAEQSSAQGINVYFNKASGNYGSASNWDSGFIPEAFQDELAIIGSNTIEGMNLGAVETATATVSGGLPTQAGIELGNGTGSSGTLIVQGGTSIDVPGTATISTGIRVGQGNSGRGFLDIQSGASVSASTLSLNGQTAGFDEADWSRVSLAGTASLTSTTGNIVLNRAVEISGPDATFQSAADINLGDRTRYFANITGPTHTVMRATGNLQINGVIIPEFSGGATPTEGSSWDLFDSATVAGTLDDVRVPGRVPGQGFVLETRAGGNGVITSLAVRSVLVLEVDRDTGSVAIAQPFGTPVSIDGYSIESAAGNLGVSGWNSLADQSVSDWAEANGTTTALNELKPTGSTAIAGAGFDLGQAFAPDFSTFGQTIEEDLVFEYFDTATGQLVQGEIVYSGVKVNDLTLIVDPTTGEAQLRNTSDAALDIDGYQISSPSAALDPSGWSSLQDQASADWFEAEQTSLTLAELLPDGVETLAGNSGYNLGAVFSTLGEQDLVIEYLANGANVLQPGQVLYDELPVLFEGLVGDYNDDGVVDAADYTVWRDGSPLANESVSIGVNDQTDYDAWAGNFGATAPPSAEAVPEASAGLLGLIATLFGFASRRGQSAAGAPLVTRHDRTPRLAVATAAGVAACIILAGSTAHAQTVLFDHNFENAPNPGTAVTSIGDLGAPQVGSFSYSGSPVGGIGGTRPSFVLAHRTNPIPNLTQPAVNDVTYLAISEPDTNSFPETQVADGGTGDRLFVDLATPGPADSTTTSTNISFATAAFGTSNTGGFKYQFIRGLDASDNELFELLYVSGSGGGTRQWFARGADDDSTTLTAANSGTPEGQVLAGGFNNLNGTNVAGGRPAGSYLVDISLANSLVTFDISATDGSGTPTALNGMELPLNSAATSISRLEFSSVWNASVSTQNKGFWLDDIFAVTAPLGDFPIGDVNLDGDVDLDDFNVIASNFKGSASSRTQGDLNDDGFVDFDDFRIWKDASLVSATSTIPEPSTLLLATLSLGAFWRRR